MRFLILAGLLAAASPAWAQPTPSNDTGAAALGGSPIDRRATARVETHVTELRKRLAITPAQEPLWSAFATVMRENAARMETAYIQRHTAAAKASALDDMRGYAEMSRLHADNVQRLVGPFEGLYQSMSPEQRVAADKTFQQFQRGPRRGKA